MQKISSSLFKANKFLPPNGAKTWNFLLGKGAIPPDSSAIDDMPEELDQDLESFIQPVEDEDSDPAFRNRKVLRSGQVYLNIPRSNPRSILKPAHLVSSFANDSEAFESPSDIKLPKSPLPQLAEQNDSVATFPHPGHDSDSLVTPPGQGNPAVIKKPSPGTPTYQFAFYQISFK